MKRPHTVILGAGATIAAIPNGDKNGKKSSVMNGLIEKLDLQDVLCGIDLQTKSDNLEDIYSELYSRPECKKACEELENRLYEYFDSLELPDNPTVYDFLVLSMTKKDVIATFNWDPLLIQAYERCYYRFTENLPTMLFLHGNVEVGYCSKDVLRGTKDLSCPVCHKPFKPTKLLYPIAEKNYQSDDFISKNWDDVEKKIEQSYMITIFGYSAPSSDKEAVSILKKAWEKSGARNFGEVSIIDIIDVEEAKERWKDFIFPEYHYQSVKEFFDSYLGRLPRRSCEAFFEASMNQRAMKRDKGFKKGMSWLDIEKKIRDLIIEEENTPQGESYPPHYNV